jgi:hypothetical protein
MIQSSNPHVARNPVVYLPATRKIKHTTASAPNSGVVMTTDRELSTTARPHDVSEYFSVAEIVR